MVARKNKAKAPIPRSVAVVSPEGANVDPLNASLAAITSTQSTGLHIGVTPLTYHTLFAMARTPVVASMVNPAAPAERDSFTRRPLPHGPHRVHHRHRRRSVAGRGL